MFYWLKTKTAMGCKNLQRFSFKPLKPFCLSSEQGLKEWFGEKLFQNFLKI